MIPNNTITKQDIIYACQVIEQDHPLLDKLLDIFANQALDQYLKGVDQVEAENEFMRQVFADQSKLDEAHRTIFENMTPNEKYQDNLEDVVGFMKSNGWKVEAEWDTQELGALDGGNNEFNQDPLNIAIAELEDYYSFADGRRQVDLSHITLEHTLRDIVTSIFGNYPREEK